jgi:Flp pilus assembly pilin Flp
MSPGRWGRGIRLRLEDARADNASVTSVWTPLRRRARRDQRGQALVEFALIAPLFLMLVVGVIQFAVALNFWFDMQRLVNQGARSAAVNCGVASANQCGPTTLLNYLGPRTTATPEGQVISRGSNPTVEICYVPPSDPAPSGWVPSAGDAVRVTLKERYRLQAIVRLAKIDLRARATMRLEQDPTSSKLPDRTNSANWVLASHTGVASCQR